MLHWCLTESLQADGSFKSHIADGSIEEGEYYATSFLARIGFFDQKERFWTGREFPRPPPSAKKSSPTSALINNRAAPAAVTTKASLKDCLKVSG